MTEIMRLQKYLSQAGICSRRKAEEYIKDGQVLVNGEVATLGMSVNLDTDSVVLGSQALKNTEEFVYYKFYKPRGIETTCAQRGGKSIIDIIDTDTRVFPVGRLDKDSTGLILLTNDGRLTNYLTHPRYEHEKEYIVEVFGAIEDADIEAMSRGVPVLGKMTSSCQISRVASGKFSIVLKEGRNRQIRRMVEYTGGKVKKLKRIRIGDIKLGDMDVGELNTLNSFELRSIKKVIERYTKNF